MAVMFDRSKVLYAHQCERCGKVIKTPTPAPPPSDRCEYRPGSRQAAWALLTNQCHKFWPARCEGHEIAGMSLEPLLPMTGSPGAVYILCAVTGATVAWNRAAELGWVLDRKGKAFQAYYSPEGLGTISGPPVDEEAARAPA